MRNPTKDNWCILCIDIIASKYNKNCHKWGSDCHSCFSGWNHSTNSKTHSRCSKRFHCHNTTKLPESERPKKLQVNLVIWTSPLCEELKMIRFAKWYNEEMNQLYKYKQTIVNSIFTFPTPHILIFTKRKSARDKWFFLKVFVSSLHPSYMSFAKKNHYAYSVSSLKSDI